MALQTLYSSTITSGTYCRARIKVVENSTSTSNNTSNITVSVQMWRTNTGYTTYGSGTLYLYIGDDTYSSSITSSQKITYNSYTTVGSAKTVDVTHNSDGSLSITIGAKASANVDNITFSKYSQSFTMTTIPRASSITSASSVTLGNTCSVKWTPASTSFYYKIKFSLGSWSATTSAIHPNTTSAYTYTGYTVPLTVANQLPNATSGTMTAVLYTYSSSACSTQIGSTSSKTFTVSVPSTVIPTISSVSASIVNSNSVINGWGVAVAGYTKVKVTASASSSYSSTISSFTISGGYSTTQSGTSLSYTGSAISSSGSKTFTVKATDSRGRSSSTSTTSAITFYAYSKPSISSFTVSRSTSDSTKMIAKANWTYSSVNSNNSTTATLYYKRSTASSWTTYGTISKNTSVTLTTTFDETYSYNFRVIVKDSLSSTAQEETFVSTVAVLLDFKAGGNGLGIGKIAETDNLEVALDAYFMGNVYVYNSSGTAVTLENYIKSFL